MENLVKLVASLATQFELLYRVGGFPLVYTFVGFVLMLVGHFYQSDLSPWLFRVGTLLMIVCLVWTIVQVRLEQS